MAEKLEEDNASWTRTVKDLSAGAAGGIAQVLLGRFSANILVIQCKKLVFYPPVYSVSVAMRCLRLLKSI